MRYEHYKRVVKWERRRRYPERKHERERPGLKKVSRMWSRKEKKYEVEERRAAWSGRKKRTGLEPKRVYTKKSVAQRRLKKGDPVGCMVKVGGKGGYERRERRRGRGMPEMRPFEGVVGEGKGGRDTEGQRTRNVEEPGVMPGRKPHYEAYYRRRQGAEKKKGRYRTIETTAKKQEVAKELLRGRRVPC